MGIASLECLAYPASLVVQRTVFAKSYQRVNVAHFRVLGGEGGVVILIEGDEGRRAE